MSEKKERSGRRKTTILILTGFVLGILVLFSGHKAVKYTSTDTFCASCHVHPNSHLTWQRSTHYDNQRGIIVHCVECHLPPEGQGHLFEKIKTGTRDVYGTLFKDTSEINWDEKSRPEYAVRHTYNSTCVRCHLNLFPLGLTREGEEAHLHYTQHEDDLYCINCHLQVGHYSEQILHAQNLDFGSEKLEEKILYTEPARIERFDNFKEFIPGTSVSFDMIAIPGGNFYLGSSEEEPFRQPDEGPVREVTISPFFMSKAEVSWDEYLAFYSQTASEGKTSDAYLGSTKKIDPDAISGPTPPWGAPDQGWGKGSRPAITMTHHAAGVYCQWLSKVTGKKYRLPTEAEWEYAARGRTETPYFFEGNPKDYSGKSFRNRLLGADTTNINSFVIYMLNSESKTAPPQRVNPNPFGLLNMLGNVSEFCQDWYSPDAYVLYPEGTVVDPQGPAAGTEHVIRGGSFRSAPEKVRCAARNHTRHDDWLKTDPQIPKSIWWYSDCVHVGFRVVCEYEEPDTEQ